MPVSNYYPSAPLDVSQFDIPSDVIVSPNAEHFNFTIDGKSGKNEVNVHLNALGSEFRSGSPSGETPLGYGGGKWEDFVTDALSRLRYSDGGGITINHPSWTRLRYDLSDEKIMQMLDYDDRVLGIEIYTASAERDESCGYDLIAWDNILRTGRRCWGFCTPDWDVANHGNEGRGRSILLVPAFTERELLKAYRNGAFYGQEGTSDLAFAGINQNGYKVSVTTQGADYITAIIDGESTVYSGNSATVNVPSNATYARFEARSADDVIYSNPIMYRAKGDKKSDDFLFFY